MPFISATEENQHLQGNEIFVMLTIKMIFIDNDRWFLDNVLRVICNMFRISLLEGCTPAFIFFAKIFKSRSLFRLDFKQLLAGSLHFCTFRDQTVCNFKSCKWKSIIGIRCQKRQLCISCFTQFLKLSKTIHWKYFVPRLISEA